MVKELNVNRKAQDKTLFGLSGLWYIITVCYCLTQNKQNGALERTVTYSMFNDSRGIDVSHGGAFTGRRRSSSSSCRLCFNQHSDVRGDTVTASKNTQPVCRSAGLQVWDDPLHAHKYTMNYIQKRLKVDVQSMHQTEISQQLSDGFPWNCLQTFRIPSLFGPTFSFLCPCLDQHSGLSTFGQTGTERTNISFRMNRKNSILHLISVCPTFWFLAEQNMSSPLTSAVFTAS